MGQRMPSGYPCVKITWKRTRATEVGHGKCAILGKKFGEYRRTNHKKKNNNNINKNRKFGKMSQEVPQSSEQTAARESPVDPEPSGSEPSKR